MSFWSSIGNALGDAVDFLADTTVNPIIDFVQSDVGEAIYSQIPGGEYVAAGADILNPSGAQPGNYTNVQHQSGSTRVGVEIGQRPGAADTKWLWIIGILAAVALFWKSNPGWKIMGTTFRVGKKKPKRVSIGRTKSGNVKAVRVKSKTALREQQLRNLAKGRATLKRMRAEGKDPRRGKSKKKRRK